MRERKHFGIHHESIYAINKADWESAQTYFHLYLPRKFGGYALQEIADALGNIRYKGISKALSRISKNQSQLNAARKLIVKLKNLSKTKGGRRDAAR